MDKDKADKFLSELKELMEKYNVSIDFSYACGLDDMIDVELEIYMNNRLIASLEETDMLNVRNIDTLRRIHV